MKIQDVLNMSLLKGARIAAGQNGITRNVESVNMMDAPDIIDFLKADELLLTTAFSMKENPGGLLELVRQMAAKGCAGLGIKTKRFISEIPAEVIDEANELAFPIIEIPLDAPLGELSTQILSFILEKRTEELRYALDTHRDFSELIMKGGGIKAITDSLGKLIQQPVLVLNHRLENLAQSHSDRAVPVDRMFDAIAQTKKKPLKEKTGVLHLSLYEPEDSKKQTITLFPFEIYDEQLGYIVVFGMIMLEDTFSVLAIEQAANVIGFDMMKHRAIEENSRRIKNEFFADFLDGDMVSEDEILKRGKYYGLLKMQSYHCIVGKIDDSAELYSKKFVHTEERIRKFKDAIYEQLEAAIVRKIKESILFTKGDFFVILIPLTTFGEESEQEITGIVRMIQDEIYELLHVSMSFGISNFAKQVADIPNCFHKAIDALRTGYLAKQTRFIQSYRVKELTELLRMIPEKSLKQFYNTALKGLADTADKEKIDLVQTLAVYLENNCQISETAKQLFIHRNTVTYRLEKCEEILGRNLKDPNEILGLRIALLVRSLL
ncbi:PucR family transcriptional regulator [Paenibacillus caui]|uniref:PucR family transcriptional regulator n=1 Tax=Paenibacillus caui TaxID=2873927 RepID=UPI001CA9F7F2|nr:PucR family transcriptional regulator [Paenibacillus caui]